MGSKTGAQANKILDAQLRGTTYTSPAQTYSALFTVIPSDSTNGTEVTNSSSGYTRLATTYCTAGVTATGQSVNTNAMTWATAAAAYTIVGWGAMDAITAGAGNLLYWATVTTIAIGIGDQPTIAIGGIVITED